MKRGRRAGKVGRFKKMLAENPGAVFGEIISSQEVNDECRYIGYEWRSRIFTPLVTLWAFLGQVLNADSSCRQAVARVLTYLSATSGLNGSHDPSAYCRARKRLPEKLLPRLADMVAEKLAAKVPTKRLWRGHRVKLVDGSSAAMWDTPENQNAYPQPSSQKPGCGFPVARIVGIFDLITGAIIDLAIGPLAQGETTLFHMIWNCIKPSDIIVGDRAYCSYAHMAMLLRRGSHSLFRLHAGRKVDFRQGKRLGPNDRLVQWTKGPRAKWLTQEEYDALPDTLTVRLVRFRCKVPGQRTDKIIVATTLLDPVKYPADAIAKLYARRWEVETDLDHLKTTMQMEFLYTHTPEMVRREIWAHLLAYNLIRTLMWDAAELRHVAPCEISFKGTIQEMMALWPFSAAAARERDLTNYYVALLRGIGFHRIPKRPNRSEPRVRKRRPKDYPLMTRPRHAKASGAPNHDA